MLKNFFKSNRNAVITALILIVVAVIILFWGLVKGDVIATNDASTNDLLYFALPIRAIYGEALKQGEILQWTPLIYSGFPVFAEGQNAFLYPVNLVLCYLLNPFQAMNLFIILHAIILGLGIYFFTSKITGSPWLSIPSGVAASICGSVIAGHTRHLNTLAVICLTPWLFLFAELYLRKFRISYSVLFGLILGLMLLIGHPQYSFIAGTLSAFYILLRIYFINKNEKLKINESKFIYFGKKLALFSIITIVITLAIGYPQLRDTIQLASFSQRNEGVTSEFTGMGSMPWNGFFTFIYPYYMGNAGNNTFTNYSVFLFWEFIHYASVIVFLLALFGIYSGWKNKSHIKILTILSIICYLLALGNNLPLYKIFSFIPLVNAFRFQVRWLLGTELSLIALSSFGIISIVEKLKVKKEISVKGSKNKKVVTNNSTTGMFAFIRKNPESLGIIFSLLIIFEIYTVAGKQVATTDKKTFYDTANSVFKGNESEFRRIYTFGDVDFNLGIFQKSNGWEGDLSLYNFESMLYPPNIPAFYHKPMVYGYTSLVPKYIVDTWGDALTSGIISKTATLSKDKKSLVIQPSFVKLCQMWTIKDFMSIWNLPEPFILKSDTGGIKRYELPEALPRAWTVKSIIQGSPDNGKLVSDMMLKNSFIPTETAIVNGNLPKLPDNSENGLVEIIESKNHSMKLKALTPGLVIINDTWYPRWKARVDGADAEIYRVNNSMRGIVSPRAGSEIEMVYDERNIKIWLLLSLFVIILSIGYGIVDNTILNKNTK